MCALRPSLPFHRRSTTRSRGVVPRRTASHRPGATKRNGRRRITRFAHGPSDVRDIPGSGSSPAGAIRTL
jgi:hypothetical protein